MNRVLTFYYQKIKPKFLDNPLYSEISESPFFILSSGRSGSTLLRKLLLQNTSVNIPPESDDLIPKLIKFYLRNNHKSWQYIVNGCIEIFNDESATDYWRVTLRYEELMKYINDDKSLAGIISGIYKLYSATHGLENNLWGDKTPFLIYRHSWLNLLYPNAKYILLIRDGRAVVNSFLKMNKGYTIETATKRWKDSIMIIKERMQSCKSTGLLLLKYEDLILNPQNTLNQVYQFLQIEQINNPKTEIFMGDDRLLHHKNIHDNISEVYLSNWMKELKQEEIQVITKKIATELREFNYIN